MKSIALYGGGYADICMYIGNVLAAAGESVLIVDALSNRPINFCLDIPKEIDVANDIGRFKLVDYTRMESVPSSSHSVVITLYGYEQPEEQSDLNLFVMQETSEGYNEMINNQYPSAGRSVMVVKKSTGLAKKELKSFAKAKGIKEITEIKFNKKDVEAEIRLYFTHTLSLRKASSDMQHLVYAIAREIKPEIDEKTFAKAVQKAERGGK